MRLALSGGEQRLRRFGAAALVLEVFVLSLVVGPLTDFVTDRWRRELSAIMGPTPFAPPAEFALAEGRVAVGLVLLASACLGVWGPWSAQIKPVLLGVISGALLLVFALWTLLLSTAL